MDKETALKFAEYLTYLYDQPTTRRNVSLIECLEYLIQQTPDTEATLNETID